MLDINNIYNEDCFMGMKNIDDKTIDLVITDPPYLHNKGGGKTHGTEGKSKIANSSMYNFDSPMMKDMSSFGEQEIYLMLNEFKRIMKKVNCYIFCNDTLIPYYTKWALDNKKKFTILTWEKPLSILNRNRFSQNLEYIVRIYDNGTSLNLLDINTYPDKKQYYSKNRKMNPPKGKEKRHPCQKPDGYVQGIIELSSKEGDIILDPFCGGGTIPMVAKRLNRNFLGFEKENKYYKISRKAVLNTA